MVILLNLERWPSGRRRAPGKCVYEVIRIEGSNPLLLGTVSLKDIILAKDNSSIKDVFDDYIISVDAHMNQEEVSQIMQKYDME